MCGVPCQSSPDTVVFVSITTRMALAPFRLRCFDFGFDFGSAHGWSTLVCQLIGDGEESVDWLAAQFGAQQFGN